MSATLVNAYVIYNGTTGIFVGNDGISVTINCERLRAYSPRPVWLKRFLAPGDGTIILYEPTFNPSSAELTDPNILPGMWIENEGQDLMLDVTTVAAFQAACDACCGSVPTIIANNYAGNTPAFSPLTLNTLCIYRFDDGSAGAHNAFADDYVGLFIGSAQIRSNFSGISHYTIQSYYTNTQFQSYLIGSDVVYLGVCGS